MRKKLLFAPLWGIIALSLLSSCRTEDGAIAQKQIEDKRFAVFVAKDGKPVNYADGFAFLMQRYDKLYKTNLSGINNSKPILGNLNASTNKNASIVQGIGAYIEFKIHSQTFTEDNGNKWVVYPKVENGKVIDLVMAILSNKGTYVHYGIVDNQNELYTLNINKFQDAVNKYLRQSKFLNLSASINPIAEGAGCKNANGEYVDCEVPGVDLTKPAKPKEPDQIIRPFNPGDGGGCQMYANCPDIGGGGGDTSGFITPAEINTEQLKQYPCAYAIAQELTSLNNELADVMNKIFKNSNKYKITFRPKSNMGTDDGKGGGGFNEYGKFNATIDLNEDVLKTASKEYILVTMYHEVIHAYLDFEEGRLGAQKFSEYYPMFGFSYDKDSSGNPVKRIFFLKNHQEYGQFLDTLENIISSYNIQNSPNNPLSRETIRAMAKSGVTQTTQNEFDLNERERGTNATKHGAPNGTKCP